MPNIMNGGAFALFGKVVSCKGKGGTSELEFDFIVPVYVKEV